jgi:hypothetical protein
MGTIKSNLGLKLACSITGFPFQLLQNSDFTSKVRVFTYAFGTILTTVLAGSSIYLLCTETLRVQSNTAIFIGVTTAMVIMWIFDRIIIHSSKNNKIAFFRLCLSLAIAFITSSGVELYFFRDDIEKQVIANRNTESKSLEKEIDTEFDSQIKDLQRKVKNAEKDFSIKDSIAIEELEHKGRPGWGRIYDAKRTEAEKALSRRNTLYNAVDSLNAKIMKEKADRVNTFKKKPTGILERSTAIWKVATSSFYAMLVYFATIIICVLFDLIPLSVKMWGDETPWEHEQRVLNEIRKKETEQLLSK